MTSALFGLWGTQLPCCHRKGGEVVNPSSLFGCRYMAPSREIHSTVPVFPLSPMTLNHLCQDWNVLI